jgi:Icc-related predicted phosphoesterase
MRVLAFADQPPPADAAELVASNRPDVVVTLGDLERDWIASLASADVPKLGVRGNHDAEDELTALGIREVHMECVEVAGWSFAGFGGAVRRQAPGAHHYSQEEARRLVRGLPRADVLLSHAPPSGLNDEPDDPAHVGFEALREWVERHRPRYVLHGHTTPDPRTRVWRFGPTEVVWVRGAVTVELRR